ncbi:hypothetical protein PROAA_1280025 [Candidatus Propionivibrio aalborgensis]|uniref:Uncharacterized protein n=1 Tax=Candidatus Propionivibrio aalborgensis TaxID=1860101 RepID=A0A1A8XKG9_9RHOO|nr:hypothetical protein PROAA_1280025 [Candidatus Propionivibrio aalborgensis]
MISVVTHAADLTPDKIRQQLALHEEIVHSTIEIHLCPDNPADTLSAEYCCYCEPGVRIRSRSRC